MAFNRYFLDELTAVRELGKEFAERNPRLAPFLAVEGQDPDVERLLEGFAFLTGRLRQKLDDELPELTHSLMALLWPQFLRPVPAMSVVGFNPLATLSDRQRIRRGIEINSRPVDGTACVFRTCYDVDILPLRITRVSRQQRPTGASVAIRLGLIGQSRWADLTLQQLRFFLHGEVHVAQLLYLWLFRYLDAVEIRALHDGDELPVAQLDESAVLPVGFAPDQNLLPDSPHLLSGFRLIQEYYCLPEKFQFFDLQGLGCIRQRAQQNERIASAQEIELVFHFSRPFDKHVNVSADNFRLFCTPVVNLFRHDAIPVRADYKRTEYRVLPRGENPSHYEIFSIDRVQGWGHETRHNQLFQRFESFAHFDTVPVDNQLRYYRERQKPSVTGYGLDTYVTFINQYEQSVFPETETVSLDLTCTNRHLPTLLGVGDICVDTGTSPEFASFSNITAVTPTFAPPLDQGFHWRLISNMALNHLALTHIESLKAVLATYDYKRYCDRQQALISQHRLNAFDGIHSQAEERLYQGTPVRGRKTIIRLKESHFASEGDLFLFASVLNELFAMQCSLNSFHRLIVHGIEHGEIYAWKPRTGSQPLV